MKTLRLILICAGQLVAALCAVGQGHLDMLVYQRGGSLRLGGFDFGTAGVLESNQVFVTSLAPSTGNPGAVSVDSPGWNAVRVNYQLMPAGASALPVESALGFNIAVPVFTGRNLAYWSGVGDVVFGPPPAGEVLRYSKPDFLAGIALADGSAGVVKGFDFASTGPGGYVHRHLSFALFGNASMNPGSSDAPTPGVYLIALEATVTGFERPSNPGFVVLGHGVPAGTVSKASGWVESRVGMGLGSGMTDDGGTGVVEPVHSDVVLTPANGLLRVGQTVHAADFRESDVRGDGKVWATDNPGFAGNSFRFQDELLFDITGPLMRWDGVRWSSANVSAEVVDYVEPSPFGEPLNKVTVTPLTQFAEGYSIAKANTRGTVHTHYTFILRTTNGLAPAVGAYSFPMTVRSPQYSPAPPVRLVFNNGLSAAAFAAAGESIRAAHEMHLTVSRGGGGQLTLSLFTIEGRTNQLWAGATPSGPWVELGLPFVGSGGRQEFTVGTPDSSRFFKAVRNGP